MHNPLVSIVIPIYKVEPYVERCINSVLRQTYRKLEIILVNDCTPDCSMELAEKCIEKSPLSRDILLYSLNMMRIVVSLQLVIQEFKQHLENTFIF